MALGTGVHNLSLVVRAHNRASRGLASVSRDLTLVDAARQKTQQGFKALASVGVLALKTLAVGFAAFVVGSVVAYSKFDAALTKSLAITEDVSPQIRDQMQQVARDIAKTTTFSATEAAEAYYGLLSAGQDVQQAMKSLPVVATFAQAGLMDLATATDLLVTSQNALGLAFEDPIKNQKEMKRVADVLAAANNASVGTIQDFSEALTNRAAASMKTYGIEVEEGVAVLAAWAKQGLIGATAGEAFAIVTRDLQKAALQEADAWREAGAAVFDKQGNMRNMADIVQDLEEATKGLSDAEKKQMLQDLGFQERSQQRILQIMGQSDAIRQFEKDFRQAGGTVEEVAEKQLDSAIAQLGLLKNAVVDIFIGSGKGFDEGFKDVIKNIKNFVLEHGPKIEQWAEDAGIALGNFMTMFDKVTDHLDAYKDTGQGLPATIKTMSENVQTLVHWGEELIDFWKNLNPEFKEAVKDWAKFLPVIVLVMGALKIIGGVVAALASPVVIVLAALAALAAVFKYLWENTTIFQDLIEDVTNFWEQEVVPVLTEAWPKIQEAARTFMEWFNTVIVPKLKELWAQIKDTVKAGWDFIVAVFENVSKHVTYIWENWGDEIWTFIKGVWTITIEIFSGAFKIIQGIFEFFTGILSGDWSKLWTGMKNIVAGAWKIILALLKTVWGAVKMVFQQAWGVIKGGWQLFWNSIKSIASTAWTAFRTWFGNIWDTFKTFWRNSWQALKDRVGTVFGGLKNIVKAPFNAVIGLIERLVNTGIDGLNKLIGLANKIPGVDIGTVSKIKLPRLARGGDVIRQGLAIVGEQGPELVRLTKGASVVPLGSQVRPNFNQVEFGGPGIQIGQVVFQGTPQQMINDWKRQSKLMLRGL